MLFSLIPLSDLLFYLVTSTFARSEKNIEARYTYAILTEDKSIYLDLNYIINVNYFHLSKFINIKQPSLNLLTETSVKR